MEDRKLTSVQMDFETDRKLNALAQAYERSKAAQVRWMVDVEYNKLAKVKLLPADEPEPKPQA